MYKKKLEHALQRDFIYLFSCILSFFDLFIYSLTFIQLLLPIQNFDK